MSKTVAFEPAEGAKEVAEGHPAGLYVLFGAEMWERFSFYGMRALLVLYLTKHLRYSRPGALDIYAIYTGLVYLTPLLGGFLADRYLGQRKAILVGGTLMALGHFAMASEPLLYLALGLLILGNGFFKPNISTMVGQLYPQGDTRREGAYTIFYMGINLGAFFSPLVCGTLGEKFGWHYGFGAAGVGMVFGLLVFTLMQKTLGDQGFPPGSAAASARRLMPIDWVHVVLISLLGVGLVYAAIRPAGAITRAVPPALGKMAVLGYWITLALGMAALTGLLTGGRRTIDAETTTPATADNEEADAPFSFAEWQRIGVILIVAIFSIVFWMGFEQAGGTLTLFADQKTDRVVLGREFPASWYQSVDPLLIVLLAPVFLMIWTALDQTRFKLTATAKMGVGLLLLGLAFVVMAQAERAAAVSGKAGPQWLAIVYLLFTLGELCLSPIGLSLVNKLAPKKVASLMMALWFNCTFVANYLAGTLESLLKTSHWNIWEFLIYTSVVPGLILLAISPLLKKMAHGRI